MVATGTAVTLITITMLVLAALTVASIYFLAPIMKPFEEEERHGHA